MFKSGFVSIIGRPNVGKSTFLNYVLGQKISIVSPKAQTTRNQITGIYTTTNEQIIFIDTPGIHKPKNTLGKVMNDYSTSTLRDVDEIMWIIDGTQNFGEGDKFIIELLDALLISSEIFDELSMYLKYISVSAVIGFLKSKYSS